MPTAVRNPCSTGPTGQASAPSKSISPDANPRVPSLSFKRRSAKPFGPPSTSRGRDEATQTSGPLRTPFDAGGQEELAGVGHRAEPLLPGDPVGHPVPRGHGQAHVCADVGTTLDFGQELRATGGRGIDRIHQRRQEPVPHGRVGIAAQRPGQSDGAGGRTGVPGLPFERQQIEERGLLVGGAGTIGQGHQPAGPHCSAGPLVGGVEIDRLGPAADPVPPGQFGQVGPLLVPGSRRADHAGHVPCERGCPHLQISESIGGQSARQERP